MPDLDLTLDRARLDALRHGAVLVETRPAVFRVTGSGALTCLQGLLTSDLLAPGDGALLYGAMLTPKGAIVTDAWVFRRGDVVTLVVPCEGRVAALEIFGRTLPPRLARAADLTGEVQVAWLLGDRGFQVLAKSGIGAPEGAGRIHELGWGEGLGNLALAPENPPVRARRATCGGRTPSGTARSNTAPRPLWGRPPPCLPPAAVRLGPPVPATR